MLNVLCPGFGTVCLAFSLELFKVRPWDWGLPLAIPGFTSLSKFLQDDLTESWCHLQYANMNFFRRTEQCTFQQLIAATFCLYHLYFCSLCSSIYHLLSEIVLMFFFGGALLHTFL